jgi:hypothetical protein
MGLIHRKPPSISEKDEFRAREYFDNDTYNTLRLVGSATVDVASISAGAIATFTITVKGAKADEEHAVALAPPSAIEAGLMWSGFVSADDTVTVRLHNTTGGAVNPASATWGCRVFP